MAINSQQLRERLEGDFTEAKTRVNKTASSLGVSPSTDGELGFDPRGLRIRGKVIGQAEFANAKRIMDEAIRELTLESQFTDMNQAALHRHDLEKKMNALKKTVLEHGFKLDKELSRQKFKQEERMAMIGALAGTAEGIGKIAMIKSRKVKVPEVPEPKTYLGGALTDPYATEG